MRIRDYLAAAEFERVSPNLVAQAAKCPVAVFGDMAGRRNAMNARIQGLGRHMKVAGPAFTVECRAGDNLMMHVALALARPGDIIVVDGKNDQSGALCGELMATQARAAGLGGFVVDAAVRDTAELADGPFPIFASGRNPCGPTKNIPGKLCIPLSVGGAMVEPGDLVLGDADGVMVFPRGEVPKILALIDGKLKDESQRIKEIGQNKLISPWLDAAMRQAGILDADESIVASCDGRK
jgi:4-hydroxy-4-methyl-2-oxoglutarate aldolase